MQQIIHGIMRNSRALFGIASAHVGESCFLHLLVQANDSPDAPQARPTVSKQKRAMPLNSQFIELFAIFTVSNKI